MSTNYEEMEEIWGMGAAYSEYRIDDEGLPFYVWHLGEATPEQPFGVCVGIHRQFLGALKLAIEKAIKGI